MAQLVMTAVGPDRPGLVGDVTRHLHDAGANIADSRMMNLRGQFAMLVLVDGSPEALTRVERSMVAAARELGVHLHVAPQREPSPPVAGVPYRLTTYSMDQPGIVRRVTDVLREHGVNIEEVETHLASAPFMGTPLFTLEIRMTVPQTVPVRTLRRDLEHVTEALNCDVDLDPA